MITWPVLNNVPKLPTRPAYVSSRLYEGRAAVCVQSADGGARDLRGGVPAEGEAAPAREHAVPPAQDALGARAGHRRQGEDAADRLGVLHGTAQEDADGSQDRTDSRPAAGPVLDRPAGCCQGFQSKL